MPLTEEEVQAVHALTQEELLVVLRSENGPLRAPRRGKWQPGARLSHTNTDLDLENAHMAQVACHSCLMRVHRVQRARY